MAQGNFTWHRGDITGDIYYDYLRPPSGEKIPFIRLYMMIDGNRDAKPVRGTRSSSVSVASVRVTSICSGRRPRG